MVRKSKGIPADDDDWTVTVGLLFDPLKIDFIALHSFVAEV